jgi:hypothetical protein
METIIQPKKSFKPTHNGNKELSPRKTNNPTNLTDKIEPSIFHSNPKFHTVVALRTTQTHTTEPKSFHNQSEVKNGQKRHTC